MHRRQWQRLRQLWLAVAGLCVLRSNAWLRVLLCGWARLPLHVLHALDPLTAHVCILASPPDWSQGPEGLPSKRLSTHHELSSASLSSSRAVSSQGIHAPASSCLALCRGAGGAAFWVCFVDSRECLWEEEMPTWCSPRSLMGWERGSRSGPPITSGGKLAKWIETCSPLPPTGDVNAICFCGKVLSCRTVLHLDNVNINSWKQWCWSNWVVVIYHFWHLSSTFFICKAGGSKTNLARHGWSHYSVYYLFTQTPRPMGKHLEITDIK